MEYAIPLKTLFYEKDETSQNWGVHAANEESWNMGDDLMKLSLLYSPLIPFSGFLQITKGIILVGTK